MRLQAKYAPEAQDEKIEDGQTRQAVLGLKAKKERYNGAIDCLIKVYKQKGIAGLYQVRFSMVCICNN